MTEPNPARILLLDIEATNLDADMGFLLCVGYKWFGQERVNVTSLLDYPDAFGKDPTNDKYVLRALHPLMVEADLIVAYYGKEYRFDVPFINTRMLWHRLPVLPTTTRIVDLYDVAKRDLKLHSRRLASVLDLLQASSEKTKLSGRIWIRAAAGHKPSLRYVINHCFWDVKLLEEAYVGLRAFVRTHPNVTGEFSNRMLGKCRTCGSTRLQRRGYALTRSNRKVRVHCQNCGSWDVRLAT